MFNINIMLSNSPLSFYTSSSFVWLLLELVLILLLFLVLKKQKSSLYILFEAAYEKAYDFFSDVLWEKEKSWIKIYVVALFFIILISNLFWIVLEALSPIFWVNDKWEFILEHYVSIPSSDINFNLALAIISVFVILFSQFNNIWLKHFVYDYFPIFWKWYIVVEKWNKSKINYLISKWVAKVFDIIISMFLWVLEIIWLVAKIISLSFRLFWNMTSWTILLAMAVVWISSLTSDFMWFNFPIVLPVLIYLQEILVAFIQALVFPLLVAIFIKVAAAQSDA